MNSDRRGPVDAGAAEHGHRLWKPIKLRVCSVLEALDGGPSRFTVLRCCTVMGIERWHMRYDEAGTAQEPEKAAAIQLQRIIVRKFLRVGEAEDRAKALLPERGGPQLDFRPRVGANRPPAAKDWMIAERSLDDSEYAFDYPDRWTQRFALADKLARPVNLVANIVASAF